MSHFATLSVPLHSVTNLIKDQHNKFKWTSVQSKPFYHLKRLLVRTSLFLHYPVDNAPLMLTIDAGGIGIGEVLQ